MEESVVQKKMATEASVKGACSSDGPDRAGGDGETTTTPSTDEKAEEGIRKGTDALRSGEDGEVDLDKCSSTDSSSGNGDNTASSNDNDNDRDDNKESSNDASASSTGSESGGDNSSDGPKSDKTQDDSDGNKKKNSGKRDRSHLRKGKWTVEEEEYTSRIIHYFSTGLLTLPEGSTLRSFLAGKLNCDPMRITKKYAGAACLGRRAYHFRHRPQPTIAEIQFAKTELDILEQRFRLRVEEGRSGMPLPTAGFHAFPTMAQAPAQPQMPSAAALQTLLSSLGVNGGQAFTGLPQAQAPQAAPQPAQAAPQPNPAHPLLQNASNLLLQNANNPLLQNPNNPLLNVLALQAQNQGLEKLLSTLILAQAGNSAPPQPVVPLQDPRTLAALANALGGAKSAPPPPSHSTSNSSLGEPDNHSEQLRKAYEERLKSQNNASTSNQAVPTASPENASSHAAKRPAPSNAPSRHQSVDDRKPAARKAGTGGAKPASADNDREGGNVLINFLSSLRDSYEEALRVQSSPAATASSSSVARKIPPASVTDSSSQPPESSMEDSDTDKKSDPSSSEDFDSDKECKDDSRASTSKGPPRKRLKTMGGDSKSKSVLSETKC